MNNQSLKQIINNKLLRKRVFDHVKTINKLLKSKSEESECYKWVDIYSSFNLLVRFGYLNELKYRLENEGINDDLYKLYNSAANNNEKINNSIDQEKEGEEIDHRIIGLGEIACRYGQLDIIKYLNQHHQSRYIFNRDDMNEAIENGHQEIAEYLFDNRSDTYQETSIEFAAKVGHNQLLDKMLMKWNKETITFEDVHSIDTLRIIHKYNHLISQSVIRCDLEMVKFINEHYPHQITPLCIQLLIISNHLDIFNYLFNNSNNITVDYNCVEYAARSGQLELLKELIEQRPNQLSHINLMKSQHIPILEYLQNEQGMKFEVDLISIETAGRSNLELIKYYHKNGVVLDGAMRSASWEGHIDIVKYLHYNVPDLQCKQDVMDIAASNGHLEVVEFLHFNRTEGCTSRSLLYAVEQNHLEVVKFLHQHRTEHYDSNDMYFSTGLNVLKFLHLNLTEQVSILTLRRAIEDSKLDMIKYIHYNLPHITFHPVINYSSDNLEVVEFLTINRKDLKIDFRSITTRILKYLVDNHIDMIPDNFMDQFIQTDYDNFDVKARCIRGHFEVEMVHLFCRILKHKGIESTPQQWTGLESVASIKYLRLFTQYQLSPDKLFENACSSCNWALIDYLLSCYPSIKITPKHLLLTEEHVGINNHLNNIVNNKQQKILKHLKSKITKLFG